MSMREVERKQAEDAAKWRRTAEAILGELPPPSIPLLPEGQASDTTKYKNRLDFSTADAWKSCAEAIEQHDADECKAHREEIDTLLVFAGLFSAVLTAFTIESYQWLQDDPNDAIIALLSQLAQAQGFNHSAMAQTGLPGAVSVRINAYWFLSLTLSLSAALVAILCKQWVREFERHTNQSHRQYISIRQMKLEGFEGWGVASVVAAIPLLLQSALGLFALGLIELLWNLHSTVAIVVLIPTMAALLFYALTSLLPGLQVSYSRARLDSTLSRTLSQCPFKSPQAMLTLRALVWLSEVVKHWCCTTVSSESWDQDTLYRRPQSMRSRISAPHNLQTWRSLLRSTHHSWSALDAEFNRTRDSYESLCDPPPSCFRGLVWVRDHIDQPGIVPRIFLAVWDIVLTPTTSPYPAITADRMHRGIESLTVPTNDSELEMHTPIPFSYENPTAAAEALFYAQLVGIDQGFVAELVLHHAARIDPDSMARILCGGVMHLDDEKTHLILRELLVRGGLSHECFYDFSMVLCLVAESLGPSLSVQELACVIALHFQHSAVQNIRNIHRYFQRLFLIAARCLANGNDTQNSIIQRSTAVETALGSLVVALDQSFDQSTGYSGLYPSDDDFAGCLYPSDYDFAVDLVAQPAFRDVYLRLLASAANGPVSPLGDMSAAETRFEQTVVWLANKAEEIRSRNGTNRAESNTLPNAPLGDILADPTQDIHADPTAPSQSQSGDTTPGEDPASAPFHAVFAQETDYPSGAED